MNQVKSINIVIISIIVLLAVAAFMLTVGTAQVPLTTVLAVMMHKSFGVGNYPDLTAQQIISCGISAGSELHWQSLSAAAWQFRVLATKRCLRIR